MSEDLEAPIKNPLAPKEIDWRLYRKTETHQIFIGKCHSTDEYFAASDGPPFFCFVSSNSIKDVLQQVRSGIELYESYLKQQKEKTNEQPKGNILQSE